MKTAKTKTSKTAKAYEAETSKTTKTNRGVKATACAAALALALAFAAIAPATALANDGFENSYQATATAQTAHYEGQKITIGDDWNQPVYAEWHQGDSGKWWATFLTYNYATVYAEPAPAGCGWAFHAYDADGNFKTIYRCEESSTHGLYGPEGVSSHWQDNDGNWY
uniref:Uncharacterized protein n=1 Tax=uncultured bacterium Contig1491 TaxID=1393439 RepID=W0FJ36_9BACT|nr:hypothetical protein [uncultured bacterium Contig1491]